MATETVAELAVELAAKTSEYAKGLGDATAQTRSWASGLAGTISNIAGGVVVGAATAAVGAVAAIGAAAFDVSQQTEKAGADIAASLGIARDEADRFAEVARNVYGNNWADSVQDAGKVVAEAFKAVGDVGDAQLQRISEQALTLRDNFEIETGDSISAAQTLMEEFGLTSDQAFDFIASGFQRGLNRSGDFLDTITEYSIQFSEGGASADQFFNLLDSGLQGGMLGTDKAADAFKEFVVRIQDGSDLTAQSLEMIGINSEEVLSQLASGQITEAEVFDLVTQRLGKTNDAAVQMQAGVGLLGTQFEDLGASAAIGLDLFSGAAAGMEGSADKLNAKYENFGDLFAGIWRKTVVSVSPLTDKLLELANDSLPAVQGALDAAIPFVTGAIDGIVGLIETVQGWQGSMGEASDFVSETMPEIQETIELVLDTIMVFWEDHGEAIMHIVENTFDTVLTIVDTVINAVLGVIRAVMFILQGDWESAWEEIKGVLATIWTGIQRIVENQIDSLITAFLEVDWGSIGQGIIDGIAAGIRGAAGFLADAAMDAARSALDGAKRFLGIGSPSEVAAREIGMPYAEGIAQGLEEGMRNIGVRVDMGSLVAAGGGGRGGPLSIVINNYGGDARANGIATEQGVLAALRQVGLA